MKLILTLGICLLACPAWAHPHEWVDWGVGLVVEAGSPRTVTGAWLELTWDEWFSALVLDDYPAVAHGPLSAADLKGLETDFGLSSPDRAVSLTVTSGGKAVPFRITAGQPRYDGKKITLIYFLALTLPVSTPSDLRVELYDPTYYADMGIRSQSGGYFAGVKDPAQAPGSVSFARDQAHPYYGGSVVPEVVVFALKP